MSLYLWSFQEVNICLKHKISLKTCCPHCHYQLPPLASNSRPGYCSNCEEWLGEKISDNKPQFKNEVWQTWVITNLGSILANSHNLPAIQKDKVAQSLQTSINKLQKEI